MLQRETRAVKVAESDADAVALILFFTVCRPPPVDDRRLGRSSTNLTRSSQQALAPVPASILGTTRPVSKRQRSSTAPSSRARSPSRSRRSAKPTRTSTRGALPASARRTSRRGSRESPPSVHRRLTRTERALEPIVPSFITDKIRGCAREGHVACT